MKDQLPRWYNTTCTSHTNNIHKEMLVSDNGKTSLTAELAEQLKEQGIPEEQWDAETLVDLLPQCVVANHTIHVLAMHKFGNYVFCYEDYSGKRIYENGDRVFINAVAKMLVFLMEQSIVKACEE